MNSSMGSNLFNRQRFFNVFRGVQCPLLHRDSTTSGGRSNQYYYKHFPLEAHHLELTTHRGDNSAQHDTTTNNNNQCGGLISTPQQFHAILCDRIRNAKHRVYLASLYIGPAVDPIRYPKESELLYALEQAKDNDVDIKILLDRNRALRPIPVLNMEKRENKATTLTSAEACLRAITPSCTAAAAADDDDSEKTSESAQIFLMSALTNFWQAILPNPYNELMGVFHIKAYIVDDTLILSGANLSEEYFVDRHDRYLSIRDGGNGLVDFYVQLVDALCQNAQGVYTGHGIRSIDFDSRRLLQSVADVVMTNSDLDNYNSKRTIDLDKKNDSIIAVAVPTFQAPPRFGRLDTLRYDVDAIQDLIRSCSSSSSEGIRTVLRLASAYLNPTKSMLSAWERLTHVHCITAGQLSHGFKPQKKAGNKGRDWIPAVFDSIARGVISEKTTVWFYQRHDWTFHAKGLWMSLSSRRDSKNDDSNSNNKKDDTLTTDWLSTTLDDDDDLVAVTHGSGNFGARSEYRDFESNVVLFFPPMSPLAEIHKNEWNDMGQYAVHSSTEKAIYLSLPSKLFFSCLRSCF